MKIRAVLIVVACLTTTQAAKASAAWDVVPAKAQSEDPSFVGHLGLDESIFWDGGHVDVGVSDPTTGFAPVLPPAAKRALCSVTTKCFEYRLSLADGAKRARIGLDLLLPWDHQKDAEPTKAMSLYVYDPDGSYIGEVGDKGPQSYSLEMFLCFQSDLCDEFSYRGRRVERSSGGVWTLVVVADSSIDQSFRMRALLERDPVAEHDPGNGLLPNLRAGAPMEFGFVAPATMFGPGIGTEEHHAASCSPADAPEEPAATTWRCLRFAAGIYNEGAGHVDLRGALAAGEPSPVAYQFIYAGNGSLVERRPAGEFAWHPAHSHWHFQGYLTYELFRVGRRSHDPGVPRQATLDRVGDAGRKVGACPADERIVPWTSFDSDGLNAAKRRQTGDGFDGGCLNPASPGISLTSGWGDFYEWQDAEQFVRVPEDAEGLFVVRATVDSDDLILESDEADNASYALVELDGEGVSLLEAGYGTDPWDPHKHVEFLVDGS